MTKLRPNLRLIDWGWQSGSSLIAKHSALDWSEVESSFLIVITNGVGVQWFLSLGLSIHAVAICLLIIEKSKL